MASRIIKSGATTPARVHGYAFDEPVDASAPAPALELPLWNGPAAEIPCRDIPPAPPPSKASPEPANPAVDLAQIEKHAFESGFLQGERAGMEIAEKKMESVMRRYAETVLEIGRLKPALYAQVERDVVKLALEVAKKVVHREIQADRDIIQTLVRVALSHVAEKSPVTVHLHPVDYAYLLERRAEISNDAGGREIALLADKSIDRGGCLVQTECGDIDARIEEKFREVERAFFDGTN